MDAVKQGTGCWIATKTALQGEEGREMSLNNIKPPQPLETWSELLQAQNKHTD